MGLQSREISGRAELLEVRPERCLRRMPGRETFVWRDPSAGSASPSSEAATDGRRVLVKRFDEPGRKLFDAFLPSSLRARRSRAARELARLEELGAAGIPVPRPLFRCEGGGRSALAMELVDHGETLRQALARAAGDPVDESAGREARELGEELCALVARLHGAGFAHRDLYLEHVLVRRGSGGDRAGPGGGGAAASRPGSGGRLVLIDVGRVLRGDPLRRRWFVKDVAALLSSTPAEVGDRARLRFLARYLTHRGVPRGASGRAARRAFARAVEAKAARIAAHRPRHGEHVPEHLAAEAELRA